MITDKETFLKAIKSHPSLQSLINGIILSARCNFFLLSSKTPLTTDVLLSYIQSTVETAFGTPLDLKIFRPNRKPNSDYHDMLDAMIRPLSEYENSTFNHGLYVLDFTSMGDKQDEMAIVFQRLNELRNTLIGRLDGSLLVILPFGTEREFAIRAPDLWSIRSSMCMMDEALYAVQTNIPPSSETIKISATTEYTQNAVAELSDDVVRLRELYRVSPTRNISRALLVSLDRYGNYISEYGDINDALALYDEALTCAKGLLTENPDSLEAQRDLSVSYNKIGDSYLKIGDILHAEESYRQLLKITQTIAEKNPDSLEAQRDLLVSYNRVGNTYLKIGDIEHAEESYRQLLKTTQRIVEKNPDSLEAQRDLSISYDKIGDIYLTEGDITQAEVSYRESLKTRIAIAEKNPDSLEAQRDLSISYDNIANIYLKMGDITQAEVPYRESLKITQIITEKNPDSLEAQRDLLVSYNNIGGIFFKTGAIEHAQEVYSKSLQIAQGIVEKNPNNLEAQRDLSISYARLGEVYEKLKDTPTALHYWEKCSSQFSPLVESFGDVDGISALLDLCNQAIERLTTASDN
ncbi:MAG: tetratricopeptide repeat protein [Campylobacterales bacterium]|nr:tetratricopeptide repeat protein [Campylobacterales bacterium]